MRTPGKSSGLTFGSNTPENQRKLRELILYVVDHCKEDQRFGATKLNKILYYVDFYSFGRTGVPVTGVQYMKLPNGPAPKHLVPVREEMIRDGDLEVSTEDSFLGYKQTRFRARRKPDLSLFSATELELVHEVIDYLRDQTAREVSVGSHGRAWEIADDQELIPYEAVFISERGVTESDINVIRLLADRFNWRDRIVRRRGSLTEIV